VNYEELEQRVTEKYAMKTRGKLYAIDPAIIALAIDLIMKLLSGCMAKGNDAATIRALAENRPTLARLAVRRQMRNSDLDRHDAREIMETVVSLGQEATEAEIAAVATMELPLGGE
jgi:hypothetical protein